MRPLNTTPGTPTQCKSLSTAQLVQVPKIPSRAVTSAPLSPTLTPCSPLWLLHTTPNAMTFQVIPSWHMLFHLYDNVLFAPTFSLAKRVPTLLSWPGLSSGKPVPSKAAEVMVLCPHSGVCAHTYLYTTQLPHVFPSLNWKLLKIATRHGAPSDLCAWPPYGLTADSWPIESSVNEYIWTL